jgi:hypothetical protein
VGAELNNEIIDRDSNEDFKCCLCGKEVKTRVLYCSVECSEAFTWWQQQLADERKAAREQAYMQALRDIRNKAMEDKNAPGFNFIDMINSFIWALEK